MGGRYDLNHSHRGYHEECYFWIRNESNIYDLNKFVLENKATGYFLAKELSAETTRSNNTAGVFMSDINSLTLETVDDIDEISKGSVVKYQDELWTVDDVQRVKHNHKSFYNKKADYKYVISLRR